LAAPFPLTESWLWEEDSRPAEEIESLRGPVFDHGSVVLGTDGCGMYWHLIVTGPHRGRAAGLVLCADRRRVVECLDLGHA
jgi:hypothetical protein